ncbi:hypothetical protein E1B28_005162 [Marasmius oreades]|uniref:DUF6534 domain-containing protein n=1 Tax=Marasmius oreades TaxID=181124 RepID=A0A9P7V065_9AGAR|nr:uncharacterized protein E1B28_005162 [Marasmius oreades]KAG7097847.1 hypothetical protein E1B28_005162 [Marasmius oreades]
MSTIPSPAILNSAGPFLMGFLLNYGLFGMLTVQVYIYYNAFPNDRILVKAIVYGVYLVDTLQLFMITYEAFQSFVFGFGNPGSFEAINLLWFDCCIIDGLIASVVQLFYAYRLFLLSESKRIAGFIAVISLLQLAGAIATGVLDKGDAGVSRIRANFVVASIWLGGSAGCDITIAVSMTYILSRYDTTFNATRDIVKRIIRLTMETGSLTAAVATADLILYLSSGYPYFMIPVLALAHLYSNSIMVIFNSRVKIEGGRGHWSISNGIAEGHSGLDSLSWTRQEVTVQGYPRSEFSIGVRREVDIDIADGPRSAQLQPNVDLRTHPIQLRELRSNSVEFPVQTKSLEG